MAQLAQLYIITGCTAGGKSSLACELARRYGGEIISMDSMKIYRHLNIGTAKPPPERQAAVVHHAIDVADPWADAEPFTVNDFQQLADSEIEKLNAAGKSVFAVGGTNLYLKVLTEGIFDGPGGCDELRSELGLRADAEGLDILHGELAAVDSVAAERIHPNDRRRIIRALEVYKLTGKPISEFQSQWDAGNSRYDHRMIILSRSKEDASGRINRRVRQMIADGLVEEARQLWLDARGLNRQAAAAVGYAELFAHFEDESNFSLDDAIERIKINTRRFAKSQRTWLKRFTAARELELSPDDTVEGVIDRAAELLELSS